MQTKNLISDKKGIIFCDLEGVLTELKSTWEKLNIELGMSEKEDYDLYNKFISGSLDYPGWANEIYSKWKKYSEFKLTKKFFQDFFEQNLLIRKGAISFIEKCKKNFIFVVISGSPDMNCRLAKEKLNFDRYYSLNKLIFDSNRKLIGIFGDKNGFNKDKIMTKIIEEYNFKLDQSIAIGDSENDITMLNKAKLGILIGENLKFPRMLNKLKTNIIKLKKLDFEKLIKIINKKFDI